MFVRLKKPFLGQEVGKIIDVSDADAAHLIQQGLVEPSTEDVLSPVVAKALETAMTRISDSLTSIIDAALVRFQDAQKQARKHAVPAIFGEDRAGDPERNFGDWLRHAIQAVVSKPREALESAEYLEKNYKQSIYQQKAAMAGTSGIVGGYTVPPEFVHEIRLLMAEESIMRGRAFVQPMASSSMQIPYLDVTTAQSAGTSAFFGGMQALWTSEAATRTEAEPAFKQLELKAWELSAYSVASNVLLQDNAVGLEDFLMKLFAKVVAWTEEYAFFQGNGSGKPLGIINAPALISITRNTTSQVRYEDVVTMISRLLPSSLGRAIWVCHPYVLQYLLQLRDGSNRAIWVNALGGAQEKVPGQLFGRPVFISEKLPALGSKGDLLLIDPTMYIIGDRMSIEVTASEHANFTRNQLTWRIVERVDGQPWVGGSITLADGSNTVSPFVAIAA